MEPPDVSTPALEFDVSPPLRGAGRVLRSGVDRHDPDLRRIRIGATALARASHGRYNQDRNCTKTHDDLRRFGFSLPFTYGVVELLWTSSKDLGPKTVREPIEWIRLVLYGQPGLAL